jgi:lipoate-protein ligase A
VKVLDLTCPTPAENLACDEALLLDIEERGGEEVLRFWEPHQAFVVLGHGSRAEREAALVACRAASVPVLRRLSGGATVLQAPGCLNYALILHIASRGLTEVAATNAYVMERLKRAVRPLASAEVAIAGFTDLTIGGRKFSGNSQYRKKRALLFHGCFLLSCDIALIEKLLPAPARQPAYRERRTHRDFLTNFAVPAAAIKAAIRHAWKADEELEDTPRARIEALVSERYSRNDWNFRV